MHILTGKVSKKEVSVSESSDNASDSEIAKSDSDIAEKSDKSESEDSGEDVASLKKSRIQRIPKFSSTVGSLKSSSTSSQVQDFTV